MSFSLAESASTGCRWLAIGMLAFSFSCTNSDVPPSDEQKAQDHAPALTEEQSDEQLKTTQNIFVMLPSPVETAALLKKAGAGYNKEILNIAKNASQYRTVEGQALNLGIYGTDLSYSSIFEQTQECILYISSAKRLSEQIGVSDAFNASIIDRVDKNLNEKDSMLNIITDAYWIANSQLKENNRPNIAALVIAGGWVEGLFIGTQLIDVDNPNEELAKRIAEQKYSLNDLISLLASYGDDPLLKETLNDLNELKMLFDQIEMEKSEAKPANDMTADGIPIVGASKELTMSPEQLKKITEKTVEIRQKYVQK